MAVRETVWAATFMGLILAGCGGSDGSDDTSGPRNGGGSDNDGGGDAEAQFAELSPAVFSDLPVAIPDPVASDAPTQTFFLPYVSTRRFGWGDVTGNGLNDLVVAPSYFSARPRLAVEIWRNLGDGRFDNATDALLAEPIKTGSVNNVFVEDFNRDGRADVFIVDQGLELPGEPLRGARNRLLLSSASGQLVDRSDTLPVTDPRFNHMSWAAQITGSDDCTDLLIAQLGTPVIPTTGVYLLQGDCQGGFSKRTTPLLPETIAEKDYTTYPYDPAVDYQGAYHAATGDLNGDGVPELLTGSGQTPDLNTGERTLRIFELNGGYSEVQRLVIPQVLDVPETGIVNIETADFNADGDNDIVASIESTEGGIYRSYAWLLRNDGNWQFTDVTNAYLPGYELSFPGPDASVVAVGEIETRDLNEDGFAELIPGCFPVWLETLAEGRCLYMGRETDFTAWQFTEAGKPVGFSSVADAVPPSEFACGVTLSMPLFFDATGDDVPDVVLVASNCVTDTMPRRTNALQVVVIPAGKV